jgi:hypothetical protein
MPTKTRGGNFEIQVFGNLVQCRVFRRPDLSREEGARSAEVLAAGVVEALSSPTARGVVFDLRQAPPPGPLTQRSLERLMESCERIRKRVAVVVAEDPLMQRQLRRILAEKAPRFGRMFGEAAAAADWAVAP